MHEFFFFSDEPMRHTDTSRQTNAHTFSFEKKKKKKKKKKKTVRIWSAD